MLYKYFYILLFMIFKHNIQSFSICIILYNSFEILVKIHIQVDI